MTLGQAIRFLRKRQGHTQKVMATSLGISVTHLSNLERGVSLPSLALLTRIRDLYGCDPAALTVATDPGILRRCRNFVRKERP